MSTTASRPLPLPSPALLICITIMFFSTSGAEYENPWLKVDSQRHRNNDLQLSVTQGQVSADKHVQSPLIVSRPYSRTVVSQGSSVILNCTVLNAADAPVTWTRDNEILVVNRLRYSRDARVSPLHTPGSTDYSLRLSHLRLNDSAVYQCQVKGNQDMVTEVKLVVIEAYSVIFGPSEVSVPTGGSLFLTCLVLQVFDVPEYILWYHGSHVLDYTQGNMTITTEEATRSSELRVHNLQYSDAGNYTCHPSNAAPALVTVTVIADKSKKRGKVEKCDDCPLFIQLGATFAFFTLSYLVAFCTHGRRYQRDHTNDSLPDLHKYDPYDMNRSLKSL